MANPSFDTSAAAGTGSKSQAVIDFFQASDCQVAAKGQAVPDFFQSAGQDN